MGSTISSVNSGSGVWRWFVMIALIIGLSGAGPGLVNPAAAQSPLREMNYYAKDHAWQNFWQDWTTGTRAEMDADLYTISAMGCNTVRIFIDTPVVGYPTPTSTFMNNFEDCLALLNTHGLKAHVTLFDCWGSYTDITGSKTWCHDVVSPHMNDSRVAVWELRNEMDLSDSSQKSWLQQMYPYMKQQAGNTLCTVSVVNVNYLATVKSLCTPDLYTWHYYTSYFYWTNNLQGDINIAKTAIGSARLLVGETGQNTYDVNEQTQYNFYRDVLYGLQHNGITDIGVWTLWDFPANTLQCGGTPPPSQNYYGLYRPDGSPKLAEQLVSDDFHGSPPTSASPAQVCNSSFEDVNPNNNNVLYNWVGWNSQNGSSTFSQDTTVHNAGSASVKITSTAGLTVGIWDQPAVPVIPGHTYSLYGYARTQNLSGWAQLTFAWFDANANWLGNSSTPQLTAANQSSWAFLSTTSAVAPANAAYVSIYCQTYSSIANSYVWFDDVTFNGLPDLVVDSASWSPPSPSNGNHVVFSAVVTNQGNAPTPAGTTVGVGFTLDGAEVTWGSYNYGLDPGATLTITASNGPNGVNYWTATAGSHTLQSYVDDVNRILESNEANNTLDSTVNVAPATPSGLIASPGDKTASLSWTAAGGATSYNVKRSTTNGGPYTLVQSGVTTTGYTDTGLTNGVTYYYVVSAVNSGIESGNSGQASVLSLPDLVVTSLTWTPASPLTGNHVVFTAIVKNQGTASTPTGVEIGVGFYIDGSDVSWSGNDTTSLAPGKSVTLTANSGPTGVNYWVATHGSHTAKAWVDDAGRITESNEGNNTLSKTITVN